MVQTRLQYSTYESFEYPDVPFYLQIICTVKVIHNIEVQVLTFSKGIITNLDKLWVAIGLQLFVNVLSLATQSGGLYVVVVAVVAVVAAAVVVLLVVLVVVLEGAAKRITVPFVVAYLIT